MTDDSVRPIKFNLTALEADILIGVLDAYAHDTEYGQPDGLNKDVRSVAGSFAQAIRLQAQRD